MNKRAITYVLAQIGVVALVMPLYYWGATQHSTILCLIGTVLFCVGMTIVEDAK